MPRRQVAQTAAIRFDIIDGPDATATVAGAVAAIGGRIRTLATVRPIAGDPAQVAYYEAAGG